jgi:hypothetical protein
MCDGLHEDDYRGEFRHLSTQNFEIDRGAGGVARPGATAALGRTGVSVP